MKTSIPLCLLVGITLPSLVLAQTAQTTSPSRLPASDHPPAKNAYIGYSNCGAQTDNFLSHPWGYETFFETPEEKQD
ncbi:MAG: hypothetical protein WA974_13540 [Thermodesulfobacteriota bacterium]